ncbi:DNA cytosine methyltransferase [Bacteroides neonati]|uniref:DNA cytosine methyltransferase n=1 Tax=Bacteroides neonati TaxID=1347393 RepID=UPI0004B2EF6E|nr:DNA cytosine methyltransferase [Bacteroides neonati]
MNQMTKVHASLFSGFGAADLAATWMGWDNAFWCEIEDFPRTVLSYWFPQSIGYGNIKETDFTPWRGKIDVLTGGFPCQPFSVAGQRKGADDDRYLWPEMLRAIREIRPTWIIGENVNGILSMVQPGNEATVESQTSLFEENDKETILEQEYVVETVCRSIEQEGYSVQPIVIPACSVEAPHIRYRVFFIAHRSDARAESVQREREDGVCESDIVANTKCKGIGQIQQEVQSKKPNGYSIDGIGNEWNVTNANGQMLQEWFEAGGWPDSTKTTTGMDNGTERFGGLRYAPNAKSQRFQECYISSFREKSGFNCRAHNATKRDWRDFPTQSPICRGNDGLPFDVVCLTVSLTAWCTGAIKGYGNAIVPEVMYEIFKALEEVEQLT